MKTQVLLILTAFLCCLPGGRSATFMFHNKCPYTIYPATLAGASSPQLPTTGFTLTADATSSLPVPSPWSGRVWARYPCTTDTTGKFTCETGDCGSGQIECHSRGGAPPTSLAEFTVASNSNGTDFYDISLVDGFNLPVSVTPQGASLSSGQCETTSCLSNLNNGCPSTLVAEGSSGEVIGCKSACLAFQEPQYCCSGYYGTPQTCQPTNYSMYFKSGCPQAYSYAFDDKTSTFTCKGANYLITFCP